MRKILNFTFFILVLFMLSACESGGINYTVYVKNADGNRLISEERVMIDGENASKSEVVSFLIDELTKSPQTEGGINVLPDKTKLLSTKIRGKTAVIDLSKEYYKNKDVDELLARVAIVNTLCGIDGIENVRINIDGKALVSTTTGAEIGVISRSSIANGPQDSEIAEKEIVTIYYPNKDGEKLVAEKREIELQASLSVERLIISELTKAPRNENLLQIIPSDIKVISAETNDGVCFVNLSGDIVSKISAGSSSTTMALYSIVNSLTELEHIDSVQILLDGKTGVEFGNYVLDVPLERNKNLIEEN